MKILVTGFDPFGGESMNPAIEAVKGLSDEIGGTEIVRLEIPTVFHKSAVVLEEATLPIKAMVEAIKEAGLPSSVSNTAGTFVCNHIMYQALKRLLTSKIKMICKLPEAQCTKEIDKTSILRPLVGGISRFLSDY
ncbi:hypothetical protein B8A33_02590 [Dolosigranulum pigrum]|nr:hypothetical protein [Dolosigranulum pigrum]RAN57150.1 hypothetical protein B8A33_02590 [Dolosigranulum pigrum]